MANSVFAKKLFSLGTGLFVFVSTVLLFQNCSGDDVGFTSDPSSANAFAFAVTRKVSIDPNSSENRPKIHLTTIMDNSFSTEQIHSDLISGFSKAIGQVQGFNVEADLYTTTNSDQWGGNSDDTKDVVTYIDAQGKEVELPASQKNLVPANTSFVEKTVHRLAPSWFANRQSLSYLFESDNFENFKKNYVDGVSALGTTGDQDELGLCTLVKKAQESKNFSDPDNKSYHVYLLATNEDDFTTLANCPIETRQETKLESKTKTQSCNGSDPDCRFKATIEQKPLVSQAAQVDYSYDKATSKIYYTGTKYTEKYTYSYDQAVHGITYEKRQAKSSYRVKKTCKLDNVEFPCENYESAKTKTITGTCTAGASERACVGSEIDDAASLFGVAKSTLNGCLISCTESWLKQVLPVAKIPNQGNSCSQAVSSCSGSELSIVAGDAGTSTSNVRQCERTCETESVPGSYSLTNKVLACTRPANDACNSSEKSTAASKLGVSVGEVKTCNYNCTASTVNSNKTLPTSMMSSAFSCSASDTRNPCLQSDKDWLDSKNPGFDKSQLTSCRVECKTSKQTGSFSIASKDVTCPSSGVACSGANQSLAASKFGGSVSDLSSCSTSCSDTSTSQPSCVLTDVADGNLCSNNASMVNQCKALGFNDLDTNKCSLSNGSKTITEQSMVKGPKVDIDIDDLDGAQSGSDLPIAVADHLKAVHGANGFYAGFIIHPSDDPTCVAPAQFSTGARYEELADHLGSQNANTFPVCLKDYSPALGSVIDIAIENVLTNFNLTMDKTEFVSKVDAINYDGTVVEVPSDRYEVFKSTLIFKDKNDFKNVESFDIWITKP